MATHDVDTDTLADFPDDDQTPAEESCGDRGEDLQNDRDRTALAMERAFALGSEGRRPEPLTRSPHGVLHKPGNRAERPARIRPATRPQVAIPPAAIDHAPALSLWARLEIASKLLRGGAFDRQAKCQRTRRVKSDESIGVARFDSGAYTLAGLVRCGLWTCPSCGPQRARDTASKLAVCMHRHMFRTEHDVWMLTLAPPHTLATDLGDHAERLRAAREFFWRSRAWRRFAARWGLVGRVGVMDATHGGPNGCHLHYHIALFVERAWIPSTFIDLDSQSRERVERDPIEPAHEYGHDAETADEKAARLVRNARRWASYHKRLASRAWPSVLARNIVVAAHAGEVVPAQLEAVVPELVGARQCSETVRAAWLRELRGGLLPAWERACLDAGIRIDNYTAFRAHAIDLAPSEKASSYFTKWGLADEVGAPTAKTRSHLRLLDAVAAGVDAAGDAFLTFREAIDGHAWVVGLADVCQRLGVTDDDADAYREELRAKRLAELERDGKAPEPKRELRLVIRPHLYAGALAAGWPVVFAEIDRLADVDALDGEALQHALDRYLFDWRLRSRGPPSSA